MPSAGITLEVLDEECFFSYVQMPRGVPVATVAIGNAANAGLLAVRIIGTQDAAMLRRMLDYLEGMKSTVLQKAARLEAGGWESYQI